MSFVSVSGPTALLDGELMKIEAQNGYTCDITLASLIQEAIGDEGVLAEKVGDIESGHAATFELPFLILLHV